VAKPGIDLATLSDQDVVLQARDGRQAAYRELVRRYERPIFSLIYRMVRNREQAEDLSQETFVKALNAIESYRPEYKFSSWIFKIANNVSIDHLRRRELDTLSLDGSPHALTPEAIQASALQLGDRQETALEELEAKELGGEIEFLMGGEKHTITKTCLIFVPKGVNHCPVLIKRIDTPIFMFEAANDQNYVKNLKV